MIFQILDIFWRLWFFHKRPTLKEKTILFSEYNIDWKTGVCTAPKRKAKVMDVQSVCIIDVVELESGNVKSCSDIKKHWEEYRNEYM